MRVKMGDGMGNDCENGCGMENDRWGNTNLSLFSFSSALCQCYLLEIYKILLEEKNLFNVICCHVKRFAYNKTCYKSLNLTATCGALNENGLVFSCCKSLFGEATCM